MKRLNLISAIIILTFLSIPFSALAEKAQGPIIVLDEKVFNFNEVKEGEILEHTFKVVNKGAQPLRIKDVKPG